MNLKQAKALTFPCMGFYKNQSINIIAPELGDDCRPDFHGLILETLEGIASKKIAVCSLDVETPDTLEIKQAQQARARIHARDKHEALTSLGLVRVRGALGGIYYE